MENNIIDKRTKGEWKVSGRHIEVDFKNIPLPIATCEYLSELKKGEAEANAAFIVTACNNYDSLLEALKFVVEKNLFNPHIIGMDTAQKAIEKTIIK